MALEYDIMKVRSQDIELGYGLDDRGFLPRQGLGIFLFTNTPKPALGPSGYQRLFPRGGKAALA